MEFSIKFETFKSGWSIIPRLYFPKNVVFPSLKIDFVLANNADPDKISPSYGISLSGLSLFVKEPFQWFLVEQNGPGIFFGHAKFSNIFFVYLICLIFFFFVTSRC